MTARRSRPRTAWPRSSAGRVRDALGKMLMADTASLEAIDAKTFKLVLKQPFPLLLDVLGKPNAPLPVMMPARLAATPADQRIPEPIGSGPFRFVKDRVAAGQRDGAGAQSRLRAAQGEAPDFLAGGKNVKIDQLILRVMPDQSTGANALIAGEIDYMQYLPFDMLPLLEKEKSVKLMGLGGIHQFQGNFRLNHASPPFDNPAVRQGAVEARRPGRDADGDRRARALPRQVLPVVLDVRHAAQRPTPGRPATSSISRPPAPS